MSGENEALFNLASAKIIVALVSQAQNAALKKRQCVLAQYSVFQRSIFAALQARFMAITCRREIDADGTAYGERQHRMIFRYISFPTPRQLATNDPQ